MTDTENTEQTVNEQVVNKYEKLGMLKTEVDTLKKEYKIAKEAYDNGIITEEDKKAKGQLLLEKEYKYQKLKNEVAQENGTYESPKIGSWIVTKGRWGYRRVKVMADEFCGWK